MANDELYTVGDDGTIVLKVHVQPGAGRSSVVGRHGDALKVRVGAPPEKDRANQACADLLAQVFGVAARDISLVAGQTSRQKRFALKGADAEQFHRILHDLVTGKDDRGLEPRRPMVG